MRTRLAVLLAVAASAALLGPAVAPGPARAAESTFKAGKMTVNGLEVRDLSCRLKGGSFLSLALVVGALAGQKAGLDACAPAGAAFRGSWTWAGGPANFIQIRASSAPGKNACFSASLAKASGPDGTCEALILAGDAKGAKAAADALK